MIGTNNSLQKERGIDKKHKKSANNQREYNLKLEATVVLHEVEVNMED
jgi:hypothetical protein